MSIPVLPLSERKSNMPPLTNLNLELGAHILWISSTHEYYSSTKYELLTPSLSLSTVAYSIFVPVTGVRVFKIHDYITVYFK